jgi:hypothetical protein
MDTACSMHDSYENTYKLLIRTCNFCSGNGLLSGFIRHGNGPSVSGKSEKYLDLLNDCQIPKKNCSMELVKSNIVE